MKISKKTSATIELDGKEFCSLLNICEIARRSIDKSQVLNQTILTDNLTTGDIQNLKEFIELIQTNE